MKIKYTDELEFADSVGLQAEYEELERIESNIDLNTETITFINEQFEEYTTWEDRRISKSEYDNLKRKGKNVYSLYLNNNTIGYFEEKKTPIIRNNEIQKEKEAEDDYEYKIYFSFDRNRNPIVNGKDLYGSADSAKMIYSTLVNDYNNGISFIREYLNNDYNDRIADDVHKMLNDYFVKGVGSLEYISDFIVEDIDLCMSCGILSINFRPSESTLKSRKRLGIYTEEPFYATGALLKCLHFTFKLKEVKKNDNRA